MRLKAQHSAIKSGALPFSSDKVKKMEQIFNAFIGMLFLFILTFGGISITTAAISQRMLKNMSPRLRKSLRAVIMLTML